MPPYGRGELLAVAALAAAGIAAKLMRLDAITGGHWERLTFSDEASYYLAAARLIHEQGLAFFSTDRSLWNGPLVPLWLLLFSMRVALVKVMNVLLLAGAGLLAWHAARAQAGRGAALVALLLCTVHVPFNVFGPTVLSEPLFIFLVTLSFWIAHRAAGRAGWMAAAGVVVGLAALTRPTVQLWPPFAFALAMALGLLARALAAHRRATAVLLAGFCLLVVPVVARNALVLGRPAIANGFGAVLYLGNDLRKDGDEPSYSGFEFDTGEWTAPFGHLDSEGDKRLLHRAVEYIRAHPADIALLTSRKVVRYLLGEPVSYLHPHRDIVSAARARRPALGAALLEMVTTLIAVLLGVAGILRNWRDLPAFLAGSFVAYMTALHALSFPIPRLALPLFPVLAIYAGCAVVALAGPGRRAGETLAATLVPVALAAMCLWNVGRPPLLVPPQYASFFDETVTTDLGRWTSRCPAPGGEGAKGGALACAFSGPVGPIATAFNQAILLRLSVPSSPTPTRVRVFWTGDGTFDDHRSIAFDVLADGAAHDYRVVSSPAAGWTGSITALRIEIVGVSDASVVRLDHVRIVR